MKNFLMLLTFLSTIICMDATGTESSASVKVAIPRKPTFYSQASQDEFVYTLLYKIAGQKTSGYYLDIGAGDPVIDNNSHFFEKKLKWDGINLDNGEELEDKWAAKRKNLFMKADALNSNYSDLLASAPNVIDYLSIDTDNNYDAVLQLIPFNDYTFKVLTIEHDFYKFGNKFRDNERSILESYGYYLLCPDVSHPLCGAFEDWWIHPSAFSPTVFDKLKSLDLKNKDHAEIVRILKKIKVNEKNSEQ